jgi:hypothetical protein
MANGTRLSQMQKEIDLMGSQMGEILELKSQIMALATSINTLLKDKASSLEHEDNHRDRHGEHHRKRQHFNEEKNHGGYRKFNSRVKMDFLRFDVKMLLTGCTKPSSTLIFMKLMKMTKFL